MRSVYLKELYIYFSSPIFYAVACIFLCIAGVFFYNSMVSESMLAAQIAQYQITTEIGLTDIILRPLFDGIGILVLFLVPILSMRLYAEEKAHGTIELVFTYPLSDFSVLAGKYLSGITVLGVMIGITALYMIILRTMATIDWGVVITGYLGLILMGGAFLALGVFASSLTRNQIVAAVITLGLILGFWIIGGFANILSGTYMGQFLEEISLLEHLNGFFKGMITVKDVAFYLGFILFFLFLTLRILESHTWRGGYAEDAEVRFQCRSARGGLPGHPRRALPVRPAPQQVMGFLARW